MIYTSPPNYIKSIEWLKKYSSKYETISSRAISHDWLTNISTIPAQPDYMTFKTLNKLKF